MSRSTARESLFSALRSCQELKDLGVAKAVMELKAVDKSFSLLKRTKAGSGCKVGNREDGEKGHMGGETPTAFFLGEDMWICHDIPGIMQKRKNHL